MKLLNDSLTRGHVMNFATQQDLEEVYDMFINPLFGQAVLPQSVAIEILEKCPESLSIVRNAQSNELVGFYSLVSLTDMGYQQLVEKQITGVDLTGSVVLASKKEKAYLAGIASFGNRAKVATLSFAYQQGIEFQEVISVPVSAYGLHWAEKVGCIPVKPMHSGLNNLYHWLQAA